MVDCLRIKYYFQEKNGKYIFLIFCILGLSYLRAYPKNTQTIAHVDIDEYKYPSINSSIDLNANKIIKLKSDTTIKPITNTFTKQKTSIKNSFTHESNHTCTTPNRFVYLKKHKCASTTLKVWKVIK